MLHTDCDWSSMLAEREFHPTLSAKSWCAQRQFFALLLQATRFLLAWPGSRRPSSCIFAWKKCQYFFFSISPKTCLSSDFFCSRFDVYSTAGVLSFGEFNFGDAFLLVVVDDSTELRWPSLIQHTQSRRKQNLVFSTVLVVFWSCRAQKSLFAFGLCFYRQPCNGCSAVLEAANACRWTRQAVAGAQMQMQDWAPWRVDPNHRQIFQFSFWDFYHLPVVECWIQIQKHAWQDLASLLFFSSILFTAARIFCDFRTFHFGFSRIFWRFLRFPGFLIRPAWAWLTCTVHTTARHSFFSTDWLCGLQRWLQKKFFAECVGWWWRG